MLCSQTSRDGPDIMTERMPQSVPTPHMPEECLRGNGTAFCGHSGAGRGGSGVAWVNDPSCPLRVVAGADAIALAESYSKFKIG